MDQGVAALLGAAIGVVGTLAAARLTVAMQERRAEAERRSEIAARVSELTDRALTFLDGDDDVDPMTTRLKVRELSDEIDRFVSRHLYGRRERRLADQLSSVTQIARPFIARLSDDDSGDEWSDEDDWRVSELAALMAEVPVILGDYQWPPNVWQRAGASVRDQWLRVRVAWIKRRTEALPDDVPDATSPADDVEQQEGIRTDQSD